MIREQVVITGIRVTKAGQVKHFQVKLPKNTTRIIGVELGGRWFTETKGALPLAEPVPTRAVKTDGSSIEGAVSTTLFKRSLLLGEIKLQSCEEANIFYAADVQADSNIAYGDFSQTKFWRPTVFTHQTQALEERVIVDGDSTILQGVYKDRYAEQTKLTPDYLINLYVWTERQEPEKNK